MTFCLSHKGSHRVEILPIEYRYFLIYFQACTNRPDVLIYIPEETFATVQLLMALGAKSDQVRVVIVALSAPQLLVVDMKIFSGTADLAFPAIS
jgi:hypothetical protein